MNIGFDQFVHTLTPAKRSAMGYRYNWKCANAVRVWRTDCQIPTKWRETPEKENLFREGIQVEFNPLAPSPTAYAA